ncbi:hypothetical protein [Maribacter antarcticus]|uniref:hypothetical protein n=1 Tax=Maribacter antarcticus TaxID=505250 RepID=UPI00047D8BDB|nr:hypothetical protein [Maribacter antarcticus]
MDDLTVKALNFINKNLKQKIPPSFLYFLNFVVHSPYQGKEDELAYFGHKTYKGWNDHKDPVSASMIKSMDCFLGKILE